MPNTPAKTVYIVHCVDTEGPLYESVPATFERIEKTFGLQFEPSVAQLQRLRRGLDLPSDCRELVMEFVSEERLNYNRTWTEVDLMVEDMMSEDWRMRYADDFGQGYALSWFILDHVGFEVNPRQRALGFHSVYDHYADILKTHRPPLDRLYWHNHPVSFFHEAHKTSNNFSFTNHHVQVLSRRVLDRLDFPVAYRPGCHCERPDINLFLELWIPFDYGNQGMPERDEDKAQKDLSGGRYGDWRRAPTTWGTYRPDFYDYQREGGMRRRIARCLNLNSRVRPITRGEVERAFVQADVGGAAILAVTNHDEREMRPSIEWFMNTVRQVQAAFPGVKVRHANAVDAIRLAEGLAPEAAPVMTFRWEGNRLDVCSDKALFGPQPWLCFKVLGGDCIHENFDFQQAQSWSFTFDEDTVPLDHLAAIGVAANDSYGNTAVHVLTPDQDMSRTRSRILNAPCFAPDQDRRP